MDRRQPEPSPQRLAAFAPTVHASTATAGVIAFIR
jgi:hypothetical protein